MVKYHTYTDRTIRYTNRCAKKFKQSTESEIKKKSEEISTLRRSVVEEMNKWKRTLSSYNFMYNNYAQIYESYSKLLEENTALKRSNEHITNENSTLKDQNVSLSNKIEAINNENKEFDSQLEDKHLDSTDHEEEYNESCDASGEIFYFSN
mgnify:CR=1 FL=1